MNAARVRGAQAGFSLLEAIVAMVIMASSLLALYAWLSSNVFALTRVQAQALVLEDSRAALALIDTINPMSEPRGRRTLAGLDVEWQSTEVAPSQPGRTRIGMPSLFDVALYEVRVELHREGEPAGGFTVRRAGWNAVRSLSDDE